MLRLHLLPDSTLFADVDNNDPGFLRSFYKAVGVDNVLEREFSINNCTEFARLNTVLQPADELLVVLRHGKNYRIASGDREPGREH